MNFLKRVDENVPRKQEVHDVADSYATHKHPKVRRWLATHPRWHIHYTPTYASWLYQIEVWFIVITQMALRRGAFSRVNDLIAKIDRFVKAYNAKSQPFLWAATPQSILKKIERLGEAICEPDH